jgi:pyridoxine kinase
LSGNPETFRRRTQQAGFRRDDEFALWGDKNRVQHDMSAILSISSFVAAGPVGNTAIIPAVQSLGLEIAAVPTVVQSNHPGHGPFQRITVPGGVIAQMVRDLDANGLLGGLKVVLTGFFAEPGQVEAAAQAIVDLTAKDPSLYVFVDPIMGDTGMGLYIKPEAAAAVRDLLVPLAHGLKPNAFELGWLTGREVSDFKSAEAAARLLPARDVFASSLITGPDRIGSAWIGREDSLVADDRRRVTVAHGTGDLLTGYIAGGLAQGLSPRAAFARAARVLIQIIARSEGSPSLAVGGLSELIAEA